MSLRDVLNDETLSNTEIIKEVTKRADESKFISRDIQAVKGEFQDLVLRFDENRIRGVRTLVNLESLLGEVRTCQKTLNSFLDRPQILVCHHYHSLSPYYSLSLIHHEQRERAYPSQHSETLSKLH